MATFNELYRKYVEPLPDNKKDDDGVEEALHPITEKKDLEEEEEMGIGM